MGMAPVMYCLWQRFLRFDPDDPIWPNRDRFVLSVGHASMLLYSMLYLTGVNAVDPDYEIVGKPSVSLDDIKNFRQLGSRCAGIRNITGLREWKPRPGRSSRCCDQCRHGDRFEMARRALQPPRIRTVHERCLCAVRRRLHDGRHLERSRFPRRHLQLDNLCWIYDNNHITIEGSTNSRFATMSPARFSLMAGMSPGLATPTMLIC